MKPETTETIKALGGTLGFLFVLLPVFLIVIPFKILTSSSDTLIFNLGAFRYSGIIPIAAGCIIYIWCSLSFVFYGRGTPIHSMPPKKLVVTGLYRFVRNPIYIGGFLILAGEVLLFQSKGLLFYFLAIFVWVIFSVPVFEEPRLKKRFGESYKRYCKSVPRWIPRLTPYRADESMRQ